MKNEHNQRVAALSRMLADEGGLREDAALVEACARLHDIGKMDIAPEILSKPGKLTAEEFAAVKAHARFGAMRIQNMIRVLEVAEVTALQHHEKWDGDGYEGLAGEHIHPFARIIAVADVVDALMSVRPYKTAWSLDETLRYMQAESGKHFDPQWIAALIRCRGELENMYESEGNDDER